MNLSFVKFKQNISVSPAKALPLGLQKIELKCSIKEKKKEAGERDGHRKGRSVENGQLKFVSFAVVLTRLNNIYALR